MARLRAPEVSGRGWIGAADGMSLSALRGRFVLLDFWTSGCINCLHVLDELRPLERRWADVLTVVGVHSPKFPHEGEPVALEAAVQRYGVTHPVLNDRDMRTWDAYAARAWPTLVLIDPRGSIIARYAGEGHAHAIDALLDAEVPRAEADGTLRRGDGPAAGPHAAAGALAFPSGLLDLGDGTLLVADTAHHQLVRLRGTGPEVLDRWGSGQRGLRDGGPAIAALNEPQGLCRLPADVAADAGYDVVVADTVNHALRGLRLADGVFRTVAGTGQPWTPGNETALSSPWDVAWWQGTVWVAMAGIHQLWTFDPRTGVAAPSAGTRTEGLRDGPLADAWFAQPSALAPDGDRLLVADAETSALRCVAGGAVTTAVGTGLFDFGFADGPTDKARLQHPLGVAVLPDGDVAVSDAYNGAIRRFTPTTGILTTMATGLDEPSHVIPRGGRLVVCESAAHRLVEVSDVAQAEAPDIAGSVERAPTPVAATGVRLVVEFTPPPGQHLDDRYGPATRVHVSATPAALVRGGDGGSSDLVRKIAIDPVVSSGVLHVSATAASCSTGSGAACHLHQQDWGIPVIVEDGAPAELRLTLGAADPSGP